MVEIPRSDAPSEGHPRERVSIWLAICLALVPAFIKVLCYPRNVGSDDAYIHLQIATNFVHGLGWGINPHQPVNMSTSPAFTLLLAAAILLTQHAIQLIQVLSVVAVAAGLLLVFFALYSETGSVHAALFGEVAAAFSVNLWRWNGALMEATFAFAAISATLYAFRRNASNSPLRRLLGGIVLGIGLLLRPEMGIVVVLVLFVQWMGSEPKKDRLKDAAMVLLGIALPVMPWCIFAWRYLGGVVPTTFAAKSTSHLILFNGTILRRFSESVVESILFPTLLILLLVLVMRPHIDFADRTKWLPYVVPVGWVVGLIGFYYLKTPKLESTGRYVLPLLPCEVAVLALIWAGLEGHLKPWQKRTAVVFIALHVVFSVTLNYKVVMPVLQRFESEYGSTMRAAAEELARLAQGNSNTRVLVRSDVGLLSYAGRGRFQLSAKLGAAAGIRSARQLDSAVRRFR
jgi:hypothetical protein